MNKNLKTALLLALMTGSACSHAAHPLITDDTGTQGSGGNQIEVNADWDQEGDTKTQTGSLTYTRGAADTVDVFMGVPHTRSRPEGVNDVSLGLKWRFYDSGDLSLGIKPEYLLATGDAQQGLGNGKDSYSVTLMLQYQMGDFTGLVNLGGVHNNYSDPEAQEANRQWVEKRSLALLYAANKRLTLAVDTGQARHPSKAQAQDPQYLLLGAIYLASAGIYVDAGFKRGLSSSETDTQLTVGLTWQFK